MQYAVCTIPVAPVRKEPAHQAEMTSQLLFGEYCRIVDVVKDGWVKIENKLDGYEGWCTSTHVNEINEAAYNIACTQLSAGWITEITSNGQTMQLPLGSFIRNGETEHVWDAACVKKEAAVLREVACKFLNTGYLWGGKSVFGIDCSGFTQSVFRFFNIHLMRDAHQQAMHGELVNFLQEARCGDLAFFDNEAGQIIHTGILLDNHEIIHAAGKVRIDKIDHEGIVHAETGQRTQRLRIIKRVW